MEELFDFIDNNLAESSCPERENSQHWLDVHYPFKGCAEEEEGFGIELLEKPGANGYGITAAEQTVEE